MKKVAFIGTGGTIAAMGTDRFDVLDYAATDVRLAAEDLIERSGLNDAVAEIETIDFRSFDSTAVTAGDWLALARLCEELEARGTFDGLVIGHGTASLEETAWCLSLVLKPAVPVVLTGAMRPFSAVSSDGIANLAAAFRVAGAQAARGRGVLVVMNDEIHAPRDVTKADTLRVDAFRSAGFGPMGHVNGEEVRFDRLLPAKDAMLEFACEDIAAMPRVDISYSYIGADGTAIEAFVANGARGIVSAGFGPGMATPAENAALADAAAQGVTVVQSARVGAGQVVDGKIHRRQGIISAGVLSPQKARILLALCLARGDGHDRIADAFAAA